MDETLKVKCQCHRPQRCACAQMIIYVLLHLCWLLSFSSCFMLSDDQAECFVDKTDCSLKRSVDKDVKSFRRDHLRCSSAASFSSNVSEKRHIQVYSLAILNAEGVQQFNFSLSQRREDKLHWNAESAGNVGVLHRLHLSVLFTSDYICSWRR